MITTLIFDFGGVLFPIQPYKNRHWLKNEKFHLLKQFVIDIYDENKISAEYLKQQLLSYQGNDFSQEELLLQYQSLTIINHPLFDLIKQYSKQYALYGLVNEAPKWTDIRRKLHGLDSYFKKIFVSSDIGLEKPDEAIFKYFLNQTNLQPDECLFIDDSLKNIETAQQLGFSVILYENQELFEKSLKYILQGVAF